MAWQYSVHYYRRSLVGNLFLTYVSSQGKKKDEIAMLIGKILEISQDQLYQVTVNSQHVCTYILVCIVSYSVCTQEDGLLSYGLKILNLLKTKYLPVIIILILNYT